MDPLDSPQLFDILGVVAFLYIIALSLWGLYHDRLMPANVASDSSPHRTTWPDRR